MFKKFLIGVAAMLPVTCATAPAVAQQQDDRLEESIISYCQEALMATKRGDKTYVQRTMPRIDERLRPVVRVTCMAYMQGGIDALTMANKEEDGER